LGIDPFVTFFKGISPLAGNDQCCGGAGSYMIAEPKMADLLLQDKIESIRQSGADTVLTANIGCMLHLQKGVRRAGLPTKILHPLVFLA
jgi:glycolate oxidase iron-sulfur subunit